MRICILILGLLIVAACAQENENQISAEKDESVSTLKAPVESSTKPGFRRSHGRGHGRGRGRGRHHHKDGEKCDHPDHVHDHDYYHENTHNQQNIKNGALPRDSHPAELELDKNLANNALADSENQQ